MNSEQFCFWMNGFIELNETHLVSVLPTASQWNMIKEHLAEVFDKITPPMKTDPLDSTKAFNDIIERMKPSFPNVYEWDVNVNKDPIVTYPTIPYRGFFLDNDPNKLVC